DDADMLLAKETVVHDYPHGERSHEPVIFRTTKQWFFKVEDLREKMLAANEKIYWHPSAAKNAFQSWLEHLRDNSITKQRYWGTPVPIWQAEDGEYIVVGSVKELEKLAGQKAKGMHIPEIDQIVIQKNGKAFRRIPDVLDVWIDAGTTSWNCLNYPQEKELFEQFFPADFILEGKDQIRGWFNLLLVASFLALGKPSFKSVYMHGFVTDIEGQKMSKSLGNIISPYEVINKHGADVLRYYMCQTHAGEDSNFSWEECAVKHRNMLILWNLHKFLIDLAKEQEINPEKLHLKDMQAAFGAEEKYIFSKLHGTIQKVTELLERYRLDECIAPLEELFLELSRTYIQMIREKSSTGSPPEKEACVFTIYTVLLDVLKMFSSIAPFICEAMYLNLKEAFTLQEESISHFAWPAMQKKLLVPAVEEAMSMAQEIMQGALAARETAKLGVRWPIAELTVVSREKRVRDAVALFEGSIKRQVNVKQISVREKMKGVSFSLTLNPGKVGAAFKQDTPAVRAAFAKAPKEDVYAALAGKRMYTLRAAGKEYALTPEMVLVENQIPSELVATELRNGGVAYLDVARTPALEAEGYAREISRAIQQLRKEAGMEKKDRISLVVQVGKELEKMLAAHHKELQEKVGAVEFVLGTTAAKKKYLHAKEVVVKKEKVGVWFERV
ncbi:MAG: class I tRNA ligase family protein, partial [Nanoarchaeota archaeon]|nr:class I tRNA ligase family protein [Nanoarchaeota archaeon]